MCDQARAIRIRELNDAFRKDFIGGRLLITHGIVQKGAPFQIEVLKSVQSFATFEEANDPHGENDFGALNVGGEKIFWKIDYYDASMQFGSDDPADASCTTRVLTIMLASEY